MAIMGRATSAEMGLGSTQPEPQRADKPAQNAQTGTRTALPCSGLTQAIF